MLWLIVATLLSIFAVLSPLIMIVLPFGLSYVGFAYPTVTCEVSNSSKRRIYYLSGGLSRISASGGGKNSAVGSSHLGTVLEKSCS